MYSCVSYKRDFLKQLGTVDANDYLEQVNN